jgi:hypothetical protein
MRSCYKAIYNTTNEIADMVEVEHGFNPVNHLRNAVCYRLVFFSLHYFFNLIDPHINKKISSSSICLDI